MGTSSALDEAPEVYRTGEGGRDGFKKLDRIMGVGNTRAYSSLTCTTKNVDETIPKKRNEISRQEGW